MFLVMILVLTVIGFLIRANFLDISLSQLTKRDVKIVSYTISGQFRSHLIFALSIGIIPLLHLVSKKISRLKSRSQEIATLGIICGCGILNCQLRIVQLNYQLKLLSEYDFGDSIKNSMNFQNLNFGMYLFIGFLVGALVSALIFKIKNQQQNEKK